MVKLSKKKKILIGIAAFVLVVLVVAGYIIAYKYKDIIHKALPEAVADATDSLYHISVKNVSINILNRSVTLKGVHLWADSAEVARRERDSMAKPIYLDIHIPKLKVSGIMWDKLTGGEGYSCGLFSVVRPKVTIYKTDSALSIYDTASSKPLKREFSASTIRVTNGKVNYAFRNKADTNKLQFEQCDVELNDWELSDESLEEQSRFLLAEQGTIDIGSMLYAPDNFDYKLSLAKIRFSSNDNKFTARDLQLKLKMSQEEFFRKQNMQKEIYELDFPTLEFTDIDRNRLMSKGELHVSAVHLNQSKIKILMNRKLPPNTKSKLGKYPNQLLRKLKLPVYVKTLKVHKGDVTYSEIVEKTDQTGSIHFSNVGGTASNITNIPALVEKDKYCVVKLEGKFSKYTNTHATFRFLLDDPKGGFSVEARMGTLQARQINEQTKAFASIEVKSLNMKNMHVQLAGDERQASGNFTMRYSNLGIRILKKPEDVEDGKRKKGLLTFIANNMVIYSNNPMPGEDVRHVEIQVDRDELKSFFNLIWKNILQGVQNTAIRDLEVIDWIKNNEEEAKDNQTQIREFFTRDKEKAKERKQRRKEREKEREQDQ